MTGKESLMDIAEFTVVDSSKHRALLNSILLEGKVTAVDKESFTLKALCKIDKNQSALYEISVSPITKAIMPPKDASVRIVGRLGPWGLIAEHIEKRSQR
jgi:hypothetical protein